MQACMRFNACRRNRDEINQPVGTRPRVKGGSDKMAPSLGEKYLSSARRARDISVVIVGRKSYSADSLVRPVRCATSGLQQSAITTRGCDPRNSRNERPRHQARFPVRSLLFDEYRELLSVVTKVTTVPSSL